MSDSLDKMLEEFKDYAELREFSKAQHKKLVDLTRKNNKLLEENRRLLDSTKMIDKGQVVDKSESTIAFVSDEEIICRTQLSMLKQVAMERELTLEETRKVDTYSKILIALNDKPKTIEVTSRGLKDDELIALIENDEKETN